MLDPRRSARPASSESSVILVTGASSGFGLLACIELARRGHRVFASMRDLGKADALLSAAQNARVTINTVALDVSSQASIDAAIADIHARAGRIDVLVNNAGFGMGGFFEDLSLDELREQFETNFFGAAACIKAVLPEMRARRAGRIVNVSSISGRVATPALSAYCSSKWALEGLSESLRLELAAVGVDVVLVQPGTYKTDIFGKNRRMARRAVDPASPWYKQSKHLESVVDRMLQDRRADPIEVGRVIAHAATTPHPRLRYLVGKDALGEALARWLLPYGVLERVIRKVAGIDVDRVA